MPGKLGLSSRSNTIGRLLVAPRHPSCCCSHNILRHKAVPLGRHGTLPPALSALQVDRVPRGGNQKRYRTRHFLAAPAVPVRAVRKPLLSFSLARPHSQRRIAAFSSQSVRVPSMSFRLLLPAVNLFAFVVISVLFVSSHGGLRGEPTDSGALFWRQSRCFHGPS
jgi:hypothetical protein